MFETLLPQTGTAAFPAIFHGRKHLPGAEIQTPNNQTSYPATQVHEHNGGCVHTNNPIDRRGLLYKEFANRYPGIAKVHPEQIRSMVDYQIRLEDNGPESLREAPLVPDRIKARHPFAN